MFPVTCSTNACRFAKAVIENMLSGSAGHERFQLLHGSAASRRLKFAGSQRDEPESVAPRHPMGHRDRIQADRRSCCEFSVFCTSCQWLITPRSTPESKERFRQFSTSPLCCSGHPRIEPHVVVMWQRDQFRLTTTSDRPNRPRRCGFNLAPSIPEKLEIVTAWR